MERGISHRTLDESCIYVVHYDAKKQTIKIKIDGFDRYFCDLLQEDIKDKQTENLRTLNQQKQHAIQMD